MSPMNPDLMIFFALEGYAILFAAIVATALYLVRRSEIRRAAE